MIEGERRRQSLRWLDCSWLLWWLYPSSLALDSSRTSYRWLWKLFSIPHHHQVRQNLRKVYCLSGNPRLTFEEQNQQLQRHGQRGRKLTPKAGYTKRLGGCVFAMLSSALTSPESSLINFMFSSIRDGVTDLGMTELPRATMSNISYALQRVRMALEGGTVSYHDNSTKPFQAKHHVSWPPLESPFPGTAASQYFPKDYTQ